MNFNHKNLLELFDSSQKSFIIPVYQRAYAWEQREWKTFLEDIIEQVEGDNNYFFGNILLETIKKGVQYEIIDGQQRLTTLTIFMRSLFTVLKEREEGGEDLHLSLAEKERIFLKDGGNKKLRPVTYDMACYDALIMDGKKSFETSTASQKRIKGAKVYFIRELQGKSTNTLINILEKLESTEITSIELIGKKDAALMFELQNNRGKDLTNMEKLKSYFMYQMYVYSKPEETETNIEHVSNIFKLIYHLISDISRINEDSILIYHCNAYIKGYAYRTIEDIKEVFRKSGNKVKWIIDFIEELHTSFSNIKRMELCRDKYLKRLYKLKIPVFVYAFLIKGYKHFGNDDIKLSKMFHIMEVLVFRYYLINSRADIVARLNEVLLGFDGDVDALKTALKNKLNESWYWGDTKMRNTLDEWMYDNSVLNYLLWRYEASIQRKGYVVGSLKLENEQIEHISPQVPPNQLVACGYEVDEKGEYSDEFKRDYLNCLGNLMLISGSHNASIGNRPFKEKLESYKGNPLLNQQAEIKSYISGTADEPVWDTEAIDRRHKVILNFAAKKWSFDNIK
ncbi:DUF262 domain-containing protein [Pararcticibacter amylolyticus]|uniref:DUF262 domain-containing protein n=1 Tax=Pararcticibacter amylolyticus TaxID=2173175 RepID=A0A2U2PMP7_9SPHI|nr:DUF262 domain-containing protein [Pararcticibacter amylolyticus]PWG82598.1 DUF262 domain-containing protein [Pararcticibacter amylolyticus]